MDVSVIICTYKRRRELQATLDVLTAQRIPEGCSWEVVVVDNDGRDLTAELCAEYTDRLPIQCVVERRPGKGNALNTAIATASADLLVFTDDDVEPPENWIDAYFSAARRHPGASFFGGPVMGHPACEPPGWYLENEHWLRANPRVDLGDRELFFRSGQEPRFIGANLAVRRSVGPDLMRFREDRGPVGHFGENGARKIAEEFELQSRLMEHGCLGVYVPEARILHRDPPHRLTERYLKWFYRESGREAVVNGECPDTPPRFLGAPRHLWKRWFAAKARFWTTRWTRPSSQWLRAELEAARTWGQILELRMRRRSPSPSSAPPNP